MKRARHLVVYMAVFALAILLLYGLLVAAAAIPNEAIRKNMRRSALYHANADPYAVSEEGLFRETADNHADRMWLNIGWNMGSGSPFRAALDTGYYDGGEHGPAAGLYLSVVLGHGANRDYTRYWHGTAGALRVLHLFTDIQGIKILGMAALLLLLARTLLLLLRSGHWDLALCLLLALLWVQFWDLRLSVEYLPCFLICFALCPAFLRLEKKGDRYLELVSVLCGTLTAFFDFLTTETVTVLIPLILVVAVRSRECRLKSPRQTLGLLLRCGLCWLLAYLGTFAVKWCAVSLVTGEDHLLQALEQAGTRMNGTVTDGAAEKAPGMLMAVGANLSVLFRGSSRTEYRAAAAYLTVFTALILFIYRVGRVRQKPRPGTLFLLLLGAMVPLRYCLLANHAYMHSFFTYRALAATIFAILAALALNLRSGTKGGDPSWN